LNEEKQLDDTEISAFIEESRNSNTTKKTKTDLNVWTRWCNSINQRRRIEDIPCEELNSLLEKRRARNFNFVSMKFRPLSMTTWKELQHHAR